MTKSVFLSREIYIMSGVRSSQYSCGKSMSRIHNCAWVSRWEYLLKSLDQRKSPNKLGLRLIVPIVSDVRISSSEVNENS